MKKYNFNAGPSMLPREVIENTAKQFRLQWLVVSH
jgi:phosphoserine aminotransferase